MKLSMPAAALVALLWSLKVLLEPTVRVTPVFWDGQERPAFKVECRNRSGTSRPTLGYAANSALRLDGKLHEMGAVTGSFRGPSMEVPARTMFAELVLLGEGSAATQEITALIGAYFMTPWNLPIKAGEHRIAFRCWKDWSEELRFVWGKP